MTLIIAEIYNTTPILLGDTAVFQKELSTTTGIEVPFGTPLVDIQSAQQKIMRINAFFAVGGAGDAETVQIFCRLLSECANHLNQMADLYAFVETQPVDFKPETEIAGVFSGNVKEKPVAFRINLRPHLTFTERISTGKRFLIGSETAIRDVTRFLENSKEVKQEINVERDPEDRLISLINLLMNYDRGTSAAGKNGYGLAYRAIWHDNHDFRALPAYLSIFGAIKSEISWDNEALSGWIPNSHAFLLQYDTIYTSTIMIIQSNKDARIWEIPPLTEEKCTKAEITRPTKPIFPKAVPFVLLLCVDVHMRLTGGAFPKIVPIICLWRLGKNSLLQLDTFVPPKDLYELVPKEAVYTIVDNACKKYLDFLSTI
ncbi:MULTISPECIES: hypothetical protein [unclassified Gluconobacter]|uniref:hypothetical protein n=1 Tax=unclassified Gluconobacter TaxID=2644261 RepID=UPI001C0447E4|nr:MULTISPECIES: hypothetical protein [unclassified Gluconobacter]